MSGAVKKGKGRGDRSPRGLHASVFMRESRVNTLEHLPCHYCGAAYFFVLSGDEVAPDYDGYDLTSCCGA